MRISQRFSELGRTQLCYTAFSMGYHYHHDGTYIELNCANSNVSFIVYEDDFSLNCSAKLMCLQGKIVWIEAYTCENSLQWKLLCFLMSINCTWIIVILAPFLWQNLICWCGTEVVNIDVRCCVVNLEVQSMSCTDLSKFLVSTKHIYPCVIVKFSHKKYLYKSIVKPMLVYLLNLPLKNVFFFFFCWN